MDKQKALNLLGLAMRAGQLIHGETNVLQAIRQQQAYYVLVAKDASANTLKKFYDKTTYYDIKFDQTFSQAEISQAIGKNRTIIALADKGFAQSLDEKLQ